MLGLKLNNVSKKRATGYQVWSARYFIEVSFSAGHSDWRKLWFVVILLWKNINQLNKPENEGMRADKMVPGHVMLQLLWYKLPGLWKFCWQLLKEIAFENGNKAEENYLWQIWKY